ncbi:ribosomal-protein-alanine N-acetyltransferase [Weissella viridescens]|uniref:Ribosomal-protein-alanine N-acetyltransferase n=1 Tax=Weissella viridescens TaxID=1629 RepID=A0A380NX25_WEIVI|nr:ribosomal-protein-alanine N-acetyltransferase [Weissella viridescens]
MTKLNFRPAIGADELFAIAQDAYGGSPWTSAAFEKDLNSRLTHYLVLTHDDEPIGFVAGTLVIDELSVSNVAIKTAFQKQGLGQKCCTNGLNVLIHIHEYCSKFGRQIRRLNMCMRS